MKPEPTPPKKAKRKHSVLAGADIPAGGPAGTIGGAGGRGNVLVASDPGGGGTSLMDAVRSMGLKLESRKATVDQLIVDHIEKTPTEN